MPNVSHENHLIFMQMTVQVTYIFIPIVSLKDSFCHRGKSKLGIGLFIHELLREPLILSKHSDPHFLMHEFKLHKVIYNISQFEEKFTILLKNVLILML